MSEQSHSNSATDDYFYKVYRQVPGYNDKALNDIIVFKSKASTPPEFNLIYFGGDIQVATRTDQTTKAIA